MPRKPKPAVKAEPQESFGNGNSAGSEQTIRTEIAPWRLQLTGRQKELCDLVSDLLINGGIDSDINAVITAALRHQRRRMFSEYGEKADQWAKQWREQYYRSLARHWPEVWPPKDEPPPTAVADIVRENVRRRVRDNFENFMHRADIEDVYVMNDVFMDYDSTFNLAEALDRQLHNATNYVKVEPKHQARIEKLIELIEGEKPVEN